MIEYFSFCFDQAKQESWITSFTQDIPVNPPSRWINSLRLKEQGKKSLSTHPLNKQTIKWLHAACLVHLKIPYLYSFF